MAMVCLAADARADVVTFTNGTTIDVDATRVEADVIVLVMPDGLEVRTSRALVADITPGMARWTQADALAAREASPAANLPPPTNSAIRRLVDRVARRVGLDVGLALAIVEHESRFDPRAVSPRGAMGLMQITPPVARLYGAVDPFDPEQNLEAGLRHLRRLLQRFDVRRALAAYNAGESAVSRHGDVPPYPETQAYVRRILTSIR